jgi:outer membrane protein TolC
MFRFPDTFLPACALAALCAVAGPAAASGPALDSLVAEALAKNLALDAAAYRIRAAEAAAMREKGWPSPEVGVEFSRTPVASFPNPARDANEIMYFARQRIPFPGKTGAAVRVEKEGVRMGREDLASLRREIIRDVKAAYYELYRIDRLLEINRQNREVLDRFVAVARRQYEVGLGRQSDILRSQTEAAALDARRTVLSEERVAAESALDVLLDRSADGDYPAVPEGDTASPSGWTEWEPGRVESLAGRVNPELNAMDAQLDMRRAEVDAARKGYYPDFMVEGAYKNMRDMPQDNWSFLVGVEAPFAPWALPKSRGELAERRARLREAVSTHHNHIRMVQSRVRQALARARSRREALLLARHTLVPQAEQALQSTFGAYQTGKEGFTALLDAYRAVLAAREEYYAALAAWMTAGAELEQAVGMDLENIGKELAGAGSSAGDGK